MKKQIASLFVISLLLIATHAGAQGSINNTTIGLTTPEAGKFTNLEATTSIKLGAETITNFSGIDDDKVKVSGTDTADYLETQITAGNGVTVSSDGNQITISAPPVNVEDSADGVEITFVGKSQSALDLNGTNLFIGSQDPTVTLGGQPRSVLSKGTIPNTTPALQQVIVDLPTSLIAGNHKLKLINANGFSEGLILLSEIISSGGNDEFTKLLLHGDGSGNIFTDSSSSAHPIIAVGNATQSTTESKFGGSSMYFDGTGDYLSGPTDALDFEMGSGDFTVDFWFKSSATGGQWTNPMVSYGTSSGGTSSFKVYGGTHVHGYIWNSSHVAYTAAATSSTADNQWHHAALIRDNDTLKIYIDGTMEGSVSVAGVPTNDSSSAYLLIGSDLLGGSLYTGYLDEVRISKGIARWTSNFTPPTAPYN